MTHVAEPSTVFNDPPNDCLIHISTIFHFITGVQNHIHGTKEAVRLATTATYQRHASSTFSRQRYQDVDAS